MNFVGDIKKLKQDAIGNQIYDKLLHMGKDKDACLYYNHPFYRGDISSDLISAKLFLVSREFGLILFNYLPSGEITPELTEYVDMENPSLNAPCGQVDLTPENNLNLPPEEFGRRGQYYFGLSAF